ncbi:MAG: hypothetical protein KC583_06805, partial [Myxococcales bacterium]|nr:hypothetical protein [Myxococcales bacterium]
EPTVYQGTGDIPPAALQRALTLEGGTAAAPIAPGQAGPIRIPATILTPAPREPGALAGPSAEALEGTTEPEPTPFVEALHLDASWSHWTYSPVADDGPIDTRVGFTTVETYDIEAIDLYRLALTLDTRYASIALSYATNQGFAVGDGQASLLDLVVHFAGVEYLDRLRFEFQTLDFDHGEARLLERDGGALIQRAAFDVQMTWGEVRYSFLPPVYVFGRLTRHALPRNVYLVEEGTAAEGLRTQISDQLLQVDHTVAFLGLGLETDERARPPLIAGIKGGLGYGGYTLSSVVGGERFDEGNLTAGLVEMTLGYRLHLGDHVALGLRDDLTLQLLTPTGLPDGMRRTVEAAGADPDGFALTFGQADVVNRFSIFFELTL